VTWKRVASLVAVVIILAAFKRVIVLVLPVLTPISFFGKVVDETGNPVPNAEVHVDFVDTFGDGKDHTRRNEITDAQGCFSVSGHGMAILIEEITKDGYYPLHKLGQFQKDKSSGIYGYTKVGGNFNPHVNPHNPAILVLKKMGVTEPLIRTGGGQVPAKKDGTPIEISLTTGKMVSSGQGDIKVEVWTHDEAVAPNSNAHFDWRCRISVPNGGLAVRSNNFDFIAPETGYLTSDEIDMPASLETGWSYDVTRQYFLKLSGNRYARFELEMSAGGYQFFVFKSYLDPKPGSRNLEYDPTKEVKASMR
jgi:hypothetical protein